MTITKEHNGIRLTSEYSNGLLVSATLITQTRLIEIWKSGNTWTTSISKIEKDVCGSTSRRHLRTSIDKTYSEALKWFDVKQHQVGFFN